MGFFSNMFGSKNYTNINNEELQNLIKNNKNALILDVRTTGEFRNGHVLFISPTFLFRLCFK